MEMAVLGMTLTSVDSPLNSVSVWLVVTVGGTGCTRRETAVAVRQAHVIYKL